MENLFSFVLAVLIIFNLYNPRLNASENKEDLHKSEILITNKYAERYCSAKANNFFEGLKNEKTLKYSYFRYIGFDNKEIFSKELYKSLINQIKENCDIEKEEENEIKEFYISKRKGIELK